MLISVRKNLSPKIKAPKALASMPPLVARAPRARQASPRRSSATDKHLIEELGLKTQGAPSLDSISPAHLAAHADAPILLIHGRLDTLTAAVAFAQKYNPAD
jgi:hypothetical protein